MTAEASGAETSDALLDALPFPVSVWESVRDDDGAIIDFRCVRSNRRADERVGFLGDHLTSMTGLYYRAWFLGDEGRLGWQHFVDVVERRQVGVVEAAAPGWGDRWFESLSAPHGDGFIHVLRDISKRHTAMQALEESEQRYRNTIDALVDAVLVLEPVRDDAGEIVDIVIRSCNDAAGQALGAVPADIIGRRYLETYPTISTGASRVVLEVARTGIPQRYDVPLADRPRTSGAWEMNILPLGDWVLLVAHDVTDRTLAEQQARESERLYRLMVDHAGDVVVAARHGVVRWVTPSIRQLIGWEVDEVVGRDAIDFVHPDERDVVEGADYGITHTVRHRVRLRHKDGGWRWADVMARVAGSDNDPNHPLVVTIIDAQAEVEARDALQRAEEDRLRLDERVREAARLESLSQLAGGVAHDFNNLLVGILGNAELALQDLAPSSPVRSRLVAMSSAAQRAAELTRQLLDFTGRQPRERVALDLAPLIADTIDLARAMISKDVTISFRTEPELRHGVLGDRSQLQQLVMNLVLNASDAVDADDGRIDVSLSLVRFEHDSLTSESAHEPGWRDLELRTGDYLTIEVSDNGRGIDAEQRHRIYDPFFTTRTDGRGLGLAVVSGIVRSHHGAIRVASEVGEGSRFTVLLPATPLPDLEPSVAANYRLHRRPTVLVVDDNDQVREVVGVVLRRAGFQVVAVASGREAISVFASRHATIDCVLLDLTMPDLTGDEVLVVLRAVSPNIPIVLMSGYLPHDPLREAATNAANDFVQKPFLPDDLVDAVRRSLHRTPFERAFQNDQNDQSDQNDQNDQNGSAPLPPGRSAGATTVRPG